MSGPVFAERLRGGGVPVKVCGLTRPEDAARAARLGAAFLGVVLAPSPRRVEVTRAAEILAEAPAGVFRVGVFVDPDPSFVVQAVAGCGLDWIQLSGHEPPGLGAEVKRAARVLKAVHVRSAADLRAASDYPADAFLLDAPPAGGRMGGTGRTFDWRAASDLPWPRSRVMLGGGLTAGNLSAALAALRPAAVDVCTGVEAAPGIKDPLRLAAFLEAARRAGGTS